MNFSGYSKVRTLFDNNLEIRFDDQTTLLSVTDKRCSKIWEQLPLKETFSVQKTEQSGNSMKIKLSGKYEFEVTITLTSGSSVEISISGNEKMQIRELSFPSAFKIPPDHYILMTDGEVLLPVKATAKLISTSLAILPALTRSAPRFTEKWKLN